MCLRPDRIRYCAALAVAVVVFSCCARAETLPRQVLAFYYGWWGNPATNGRWMHWKGVDPANERIENSAHYPAFGAYDAHDPAILERQIALAHSSGITGIIASWWGQDGFEDHGMPLLLDAANRHGLAVSVYYEKIAGEDASSRKATAVADLNYLLKQYVSHTAWMRAEGKPALFIYGRALH
jgi:glycoprotein endo-alpha-1,2-mannosidase